MVSKLLQPTGDVLVGQVLGDVVNKESSDGSPVVSGSDGTVSLLTGSIPDLRLDGLCIDLD